MYTEFPSVNCPFTCPLELFISSSQYEHIINL